MSSPHVLYIRIVVGIFNFSYFDKNFFDFIIFSGASETFCATVNSQDDTLI